MHTHTHVHTHAHMHTCTHTRTHAHMHTHTHAHTQFTFASNTATILGGTLVGQGVQMRVVAGFIYSFVMTVCTLMLIHICIGSSAVCMTLRRTAWERKAVAMRCKERSC